MSTLEQEPTNTQVGTADAAEVRPVRRFESCNKRFANVLDSADIPEQPSPKMGRQRSPSLDRTASPGERNTGVNDTRLQRLDWQTHAGRLVFGDRFRRMYRIDYETFADLIEVLRPVLEGTETVTGEGGRFERHPNGDFRSSGPMA